MSENKHISAYDNMIKHLRDALADTSKSLSHGLETAKEKTSELGGLTQEEINKISDYVKRDVEDAAHTITDKSNDSLSEWLKFDIELIENFALGAFMDVADKTRIQLAELEQQARAASVYRTGEVTGPGTLVCTHCDKIIHFKTTSKIPECPACGNETFQRS